MANESPSEQSSGLKGCCSKRNATQVGTPEAGSKPAEVVTTEVSLGRVTELSDATGSSKVEGTCGCRVGQTPMLPSDTHTPEPRQNPAESFVDTIALTHYLTNNWQSDQQAEQWDIPVRPDRYVQRFYSVWLN